MLYLFNICCWSDIVGVVTFRNYFSSLVLVGGYFL